MASYYKMKMGWILDISNTKYTSFPYVYYTLMQYLKGADNITCTLIWHKKLLNLSELSPFSRKDICSFCFL